MTKSSFFNVNSLYGRRKNKFANEIQLYMKIVNQIKLNVIDTSVSDRRTKTYFLYTLNIIFLISILH